VFEQDVRAGNDVDAGSNHGGRVDQRANWRRAFHGVGQPDVKRELRGLAAGSHEQEQARDGERAENAPAFMWPSRIRKRPQTAAKNRACEMSGRAGTCQHEAEVADAVDDEGFFAGIGGGFSEEVKADEQIAREARRLPIRRRGERSWRRGPGSA